MDVRRSAPVPLVLLAAIALAGCSSSGGPATSAPPTTASVGSTAAGSSGSAADPATTAAVTKAYKTFFDPATPLATVTRYLQHGSRFTQAIAAQSRQGAQQHLGVRVTKVVMLSPNSTAVTFDLLSAGKVLLPGSPGNAVRESGVWKVAAKTFCELVQLTGKAPTACSDPKVTDLPN